MREWTRAKMRRGPLTVDEIMRAQVERQTSAEALARQAREAEARRQQRMERLRAIVLCGGVSEVSEVADGE